MTRPNPPYRVLAAALAAVLAAGGCTADPEPAGPAPPPQPRYQQPPTELCEPMRIDELLQRFDLIVPPESGFPISDYDDGAASSWYARCSISGWTEHGRFDSEVGEFHLFGSAALRVFHDVSDAVRYYDQDFRNYLERPVARDTIAVTGEPAGGWDTGASVTLAEELPPDDPYRGEIKVVKVLTLVRDENLVAFVHAQAASPTAQVEEVSELFQELVADLLDKAVEQLTVTTG
ncbi:MAG: hypothetical protein ACRDT2_03790 [Natronosporangium sp.]